MAASDIASVLTMSSLSVTVSFFVSSAIGSPSRYDYAGINPTTLAMHISAG